MSSLGSLQSSKLTKTVVLAFVASSTVTMHFFIGCINIPLSFKLSTLIISLQDLLLCSGNGKCVTWCYSCHRGSAASTKSVWKTRKAAANSSVLWNMASYQRDILTFSFFFFTSLSQVSLQCLSETKPHAARSEQSSWNWLYDFCYILGRNKINVAFRFF